MMNQASEHPVEVFQRFSRRSMVALLFVIAILGGTALALILSPEGAVGRAATRMMWLIPVAMVIVVAAVQTTLKGRRWDPKSAEVKTVMEDEWRRASMDRASRIALIVVVAAQWPLAMLLGFVATLPAQRTAMAMAAASMTLGLLTLIALFLAFERQ
jgi:uncharacterized membrane protein